MLFLCNDIFFTFWFVNKNKNKEIKKISSLKDSSEKYGHCEWFNVYYVKCLIFKFNDDLISQIKYLFIIISFVSWSINY